MRAWGLGFGIEDLGFMVWALGFKVSGFGVYRDTELAGHVEGVVLIAHGMTHGRVVLMTGHVAGVVK